MSDICQVLSNFEESTQMVSGDAAIISLTIPLLGLLKNSLISMKSEALRSSQETGEEDSLVDSQSTLRSVSQRISEEVEEDEEEEEENVGETEEGTIVQSFTVQRVWAEEEELEEEEMGSQASEGSEFLRQDTVTCPQSRQSRADLYRKMLREYVADHTIVLNDHKAPYYYWVSKLDMWHELALYALEVLACPAASVLSERVFSAAGGIITDKRTRLSTDSADRLTLIKMNKAWISPDFHSPPGERSST
ncbi:hypothetical protein GDO81_000309 [Engystomops pustulosus]|uniref:HAT C-terminal dimerisation domain-containing protein n=1 Tax=Engystomops pustulosus TaxID=76066 RepID=A0AAV7D4Q8_ENGPU|nr:hypothetical protein GDO81_000309 [Engystomops pustulosus]